MHLKTILNRVTDYKSFVFGKITWLEDSIEPTLEVEVKPRANGQHSSTWVGSMPPNEASAATRQNFPLDVHKRLEACFLPGKQLAAERRFPYAHEMFAECVRADPGNIDYVEAMLENLRAKVAGERKKSRGGLSRALKKAVADQDWRAVLALGIDVLDQNPWHIATLEAIAQACAALHFGEVELAYLKEALEADPKNVGVNRHCARSLARMSQFDQAIACWHRVEEILKGDREAAQKIARLAEEKMKYPGGKPPVSKINADASVADETSEEEGEEPGGEETPGAVQVPPQVPLTERQQLEKAIHDDPADVSNYLSLAKHLRELAHYDPAERLLERALENCFQEQLVRDALQNVRALRRQAEREAAEIERQKQLRAQRKKLRVPWLELALGLAGMVLVFQIFPSWWESVSTVAVTHARVLLIVANAVAVVALIVWRQR